jgi:hypothetical protein
LSRYTEPKGEVQDRRNWGWYYGVKLARRGEPTRAGNVVVIGLYGPTRPYNEAKAGRGAMWSMQTAAMKNIEDAEEDSAQQVLADATAGACGTYTHE